MELEGKKALVVGLRRTGVATANFLAGKGAAVTVTDSGQPGEFAKEKAELEGLEIEFVLGEHRMEDFTGAELVVVSPGVPLSIKPIKKAREAGVEIIGELELSARFIRLPIVAITGTNGKSTVTELTGKMLIDSGKRAFIGGNIGNPLINLVNRQDEFDVAVVEVSSFQLEAIELFHPKVGALLNISPDHLDRYPDFDSYIDAKSLIWKNMGSEDWCVLNAADRVVMNSAKACACSRLLFNLDAEPDGENKAWHKDKKLMLKIGHQVHEIPAANMKITGRHNLENAIASAAAALVSGANAGGVAKAVESFPGLSHRTQFVKEINGVKYYDDSKGTNVGAVIKAIQSFKEPLILIAGGLDKGGDFGAMREVAPGKVKAMVLIGEATEKIESVLSDLIQCARASDMKDAVKKASEMASEGDVVLLSPGCASFDMYRDYAHRGDAFQEAVRELGA